MSKLKNRRSYQEFRFPIEVIITEAMEQIERLGCDTRLTEASILLMEARDKISDWIDDKLISE